MTRNEVRAKIEDILVEQLDIPDVEESELRKELQDQKTELRLDLGADELDIVEIALAIEEEFDFEMFDEGQIRERTTIGELVDLVVSQPESNTRAKAE